ncbi:uncharacterized protein V1518DRAFT_414909 [Limtongia smithiae]|uniref:uncharacterized protein n=1 Tax=Limtongia smithiae TaxID=1125753 RepID=UPI0034CF4C48
MAAVTDIPVSTGFASSRRRSSVSVAPYSIPEARSHTHSSLYSSSISSSVASSLASPPSSVSSSLGASYLSRKILAARRFSDGESASGRLKEELKCETCGKGYKHISCLTKHLWEHTPEWNVTSKLLISKHQQVQLLEAASILVSMTEEDELAELREHQHAHHHHHHHHHSHNHHSSPAISHMRSSRENSLDDLYDGEDDSLRDYEEADEVGVFGKMED